MAEEGTLPLNSGYAFTGVSNIHNDIYSAIDASTNPSLSQPGKIVLITGAGRGIGRAIALQYAHASVAGIILSSRTTSELDEVEAAIQIINPSVQVLKIKLDVTSESGVQNAYEAVRSLFGRLDVLVNNAGASTAWTPIITSNPTDWWRTFEINIKGPYLLLQAFLPLLLETAEKHTTVVDVVNVSSIGANIMTPDSSQYNVSKQALSRLTEYVDQEYAERGVVATSLHPGGVWTKLSRQEEERLTPYMTDTVELAGGFTVWLTAGARTYLGGRYVSANWDVEALEKLKDEIVQGDKLKQRLLI
ncbi:putative oxidoreductase ucpA [Dendryphion nanum]|uniref:Oxidoreductase ucpA n=1 Tax=Dendryphion nanum TaxID=256645 RepID=A0A9P9E883_9PLEO|nr:putative oxidoreductase ucpA [Dendryphion nanum]